MGRRTAWIPWLLTVVVLIELSPLNEALRLALFAAGQYVRPGAASGMISYGLATFLVEATAAASVAVLLSTGPSGTWMSRFGPRVERFTPSDERTSPLFVLAVGLIAGAAVALVAWSTKGGDRPRATIMRQGFRISVQLALVCAVQGAFMGAGIRSPGPLTIGLALLAVLGLGLVARRIVGPSTAPAERAVNAARAE